METVIDKARLGSFQHAKLFMQVTSEREARNECYERNDARIASTN